MGIFKSLLQSIYDNSMSAPTRKEWVRRINFFEWPRGSTRFSWNPRRKVGAGVKMENFRNIMFASLGCLKGLVPVAIYKHVANIWQLFSRLASSHGFTLPEIDEIQSFGRDVISTGMLLFPDVYDVPNGHGMLHILTTQLRALGTCAFTRCGRKETMHGFGKNSMHKQTVNPTEWAMKVYSRLYGLQSALCGSSWIFEGERKTLGPAWLHLTDGRRGKQDNPHPLIKRISPLKAASMLQSCVT